MYQYSIIISQNWLSAMQKHPCRMRWTRANDEKGITTVRLIVWVGGKRRRTDAEESIDIVYRAALRAETCADDCAEKNGSDAEMSCRNGLQKPCRTLCRYSCRTPCSPSCSCSCRDSIRLELNDSLAMRKSHFNDTKISTINHVADIRAELRAENDKDAVLGVEQNMHRA